MGEQLNHGSTSGDLCLAWNDTSGNCECYGVSAVIYKRLRGMLELLQPHYLEFPRRIEIVPP